MNCMVLGNKKKIHEGAAALRTRDPIHCMRFYHLLARGHTNRYYSIQMHLAFQKHIYTEYGTKSQGKNNHILKV